MQNESSSAMTWACRMSQTIQYSCMQNESGSAVTGACRNESGSAMTVAFRLNQAAGKQQAE